MNEWKTISLKNLATTNMKYPLRNNFEMQAHNAQFQTQGSIKSTMQVINKQVEELKQLLA